jgi:hypothetical protein
LLEVAEFLLDFVRWQHGALRFLQIKVGPAARV